MKSEVRFYSSDLDTCIAVDYLAASVTSMFGSAIGQYTIFSSSYPIYNSSDSSGVYYYVSTDEASVDIQGTYVLAIWNARIAGITIPTVTRKTYFAPVTAANGDKTLLEWAAPVTFSPLFYEVRSKYNGVETVLGQTWYPTFMDETIYENAYHSRAIEYVVYGAVSRQLATTTTDYTFQQVAYTMAEGVPQATIVRERVGGDWCLLTGKVRPPAGAFKWSPGIQGDVIQVCLPEEDLPVPPYIRDQFTTSIDMFGRFGFYAYQGLRLNIYIESMRIGRKIIVPAISAADVFSLDYESLPLGYL